MHIVHVNLARGFRGGERQTVLLMQALQAIGIQQTLVCRTDSPMPDYLTQCPDISFIKTNHLFAAHGQIPDASVVHAHDGRAVHWAWLHHLFFRVPYVITRRIIPAPKRSWSTQRVYKKAAKLIAISDAIAHALTAYLPTLAPVTVHDSAANLTVDADLLQRLQQKYQGNFVVGCVGAVELQTKGQENLMAAAMTLLPRYPAMRFIFLGSGAAMETFRQQTASYAQIEWLGFQKEIGTYLSIMDVAVLPSLSEGLGSSLLDAMQFGVPAIATRTGGIPEIIQNGENGLLVPPNDTPALGNALETMMTQPGMLARMSVNAKQKVSQFTPERQAQAYLTIYRSICIT